MPIQILGEDADIPASLLHENAWNQYIEPKMLDETEKAWLAGFIDADGCINMNRSRVRNRYTSYTVQLQIQTVDFETSVHIEQLLKKLGIERRVYIYDRKRKDGRGFYKRAYTWSIQKMSDVRTILEAVSGHLVTKRRQAVVALDYLKHRMFLVSKSRAVPYDGMELEAFSTIRSLNGGGK